jgi:hypothetical protein
MSVIGLPCHAPARPARQSLDEPVHGALTNEQCKTIFSPPRARGLYEGHGPLAPIVHPWCFLENSFDPLTGSGTPA